MRRQLQIRDRWKEQRLVISRLVFTALLVVAMSGVLVWRLFQIQVSHHEVFAELAQGNRMRIEPLAPTRGLIFDRNGQLLAENLPAWELVAIPEEIVDLQASLQALEALELLDPEERGNLVDAVNSHRRFERVVLANLTESQAARFSARRHRFSGIDIREGLIRHYPYGDLTGHSIGYMGSISAEDLERIDRANYAATALIGISGVERSYQEDLHGTVGFRQQLVNAQGRVLVDPAAVEASADSMPGNLDTRWPVPGKNLVVSLDIELQRAAQMAMEGLRGAAVAIEPATGDVLALVSTPAFDPNRFASGLSYSGYRELETDPDKPLFNRALAGRYPPGSTVKPFLGLAAMNLNALNPDDPTYCAGHYSLPGQTHQYRDWKREGHGLVDLHKAVVESCDVYFYRLAVNMGIDAIDTSLKVFGFGAQTGIDIGGEIRGVVPSREWKRNSFSRREDQTWFPGETVISGIGQGYTTATPLQLAHATAVLAAGARLKPRLVVATQTAVSGDVVPVDPVRLDSLPEIDARHWQRIREAMIGVTEDPQGTARLAMLQAPYRVAGKTGTAQVISLAQDEEYDEEALDERLRDHGLFIAFAPADNPTIALAVIVENGGSGSGLPARAARRILDVYLAAEDYG